MVDSTPKLRGRCTSTRPSPSPIGWNAAIEQTAVDSGSAYVELRAAFKGPDYAYDETQFLASDGDHPNAAGHQQIADAAVSVITDTLHR